MNLGQSFLIPPPRLTAEAVTVFARFRMRIKRDGTIYLCFPPPFSCAANLVSFNSASPSAFRGRVRFYVGVFEGFFPPPSGLLFFPSLFAVKGAQKWTQFVTTGALSISTQMDWQLSLLSRLLYTNSSSSHHAENRRVLEKTFEGKNKDPMDGRC